MREAGDTTSENRFAFRILCAHTFGFMCFDRPFSTKRMRSWRMGARSSSWVVCARVGVPRL